MGEIIPFPVWIIPFPVFKINFEPLRPNEKHFVKDYLIQRPGSGRKNSISSFEISISCLKINFESHGTNEKHFVKEAF